MQYELLKQYALLVQKRVLHKFHNNLPGFVGDLYYEPSFLSGPGGLYVDAVIVVAAQWSKGLVVFDDVEYNSSKDIDKELDRIRDLILQQGRSYRCSFIYISHQANNYKQN